MSKIIKTTRWHGSTNFIRKSQIVNYCISTFYRNNNIFQISMFLWIELWTNPKHIPIIKKSHDKPSFFFRLTIDSLLKLAVDHNANANCSKWILNPNPPWSQSKAFAIQPSPHDDKKWYWKIYKHTCILNILHYNLITYFSNFIFTLRFIIILNFKM
jgi:hypothetical protein